MRHGTWKNTSQNIQGMIMGPSRLIIYILSIFFISKTCADQLDRSQIEMEMKATAEEFIQSLGATLKSSLSAGGPEAAISICETVAPSLANSLSKTTGWKISRVSRKPRNPLLGIPDSWEVKQLDSFSKSINTDINTDKLEVFVAERKNNQLIIRYMKALPVRPVCLTCHGSEAEIPDVVSKALQKRYPNDRAIGYKIGNIRGAVSIRAVID